MKKVYLILAFMLILYTGIFSQTDLVISTAVDFTVTDSDGKSYQLFNYLEDDYYVLIEFTLLG